MSEYPGHGAGQPAQGHASRWVTHREGASAGVWGGACIPASVFHRPEAGAA
jgi:hypothetical protein